MRWEWIEQRRIIFSLPLTCCLHPKDHMVFSRSMLTPWQDPCRQQEHTKLCLFQSHCKDVICIWKSLPSFSIPKRPPRPQREPLTSRNLSKLLVQYSQEKLMCYSRISWCSCGIPNSESGVVTDMESFAYLWNCFPPAGLPCPALIWWYVPGLIVAYYAYLVSVLGRPAPSWGEIVECGFWGRVEMEGRLVEGKEEEHDQSVIYERIITIIIRNNNNKIAGKIHLVLPTCQTVWKTHYP